MGYHEYGPDTYRARLQRTADDFERLRDCQLRDMSALSVNSKTDIIVTHEVEQE
jgi:hypothetical protein